MTPRPRCRPIEIQGHSFRKVMPRFRPGGMVKIFLTAVADSYRSCPPNTRMGQGTESLQSQLTSSGRRENLLKEALYSAQKMADEVKAQAAARRKSFRTHCARRVGPPGGPAPATRRAPILDLKLEARTSRSVPRTHPPRSDSRGCVDERKGREYPHIWKGG